MSSDMENFEKRQKLLGILFSSFLKVDTNRNRKAEEVYFDITQWMIDNYKFNFFGKNINENGTKHKNTSKNGMLIFLIRPTILGWVILSPNFAKSKVKYKDIIELIDTIERLFIFYLYF